METSGGSVARVEATGGREFWRGVFAAGGFTAVPRWISGARHGDAVLEADARPGSAVLERAVAPGTTQALRRIADDLGVPLDAVLLAGHAKVLGGLASESDVITAMATGQGKILPCPLTLEDASWRGVVRAADRSARLVRQYADVPLAELRDPTADVLCETVVELPGQGTPDAALPEGTVLRTSFADDGGHVLIRYAYDATALDEEAVTRISGYYLTALDLLAADPEAAHGRQSLLSRQELTFQLEGLAGADRQRPDRRFHELFEERVERHPHAVAAVHRTTEWTYRELDDRANAVARALLNKGLGREDVVAVVTERTLDWMAAVLGVFKAGGAYLPVEPHFPADRIAAMLTRSGCRYALTDSSGAPGLEAARTAEVATLSLETIGESDVPYSAPTVEVGAGQLAYVYFTSGSTGEPKGAMCEQAGMLNHLYAKIEDLGIEEGAVVAQTAPQCFDISLWQLVSALLVGGRTLIVEQEAILDVDRFIETVAEGEAEILQLVPSYLDVVLSSLRVRPRRLPRLRCVSVTGEAIKKELVQRWFAALPDVPLANAYGLTETSDDTNHEIMVRVPDEERVPLGRPIANTTVYVLDENLLPVPLGAPGEIAFSGVCVGRGYINDEERTRAAFGEDPHRPGHRLYRAGDFGRWLPGGKLEFLGRRDDQVKIRGFRIEVGEVDNHLLRVDGVRDAAVVVAARPDGSKHLVAFYSAAGEVPQDTLRALLGESLPSYMVPASFHWRTELPLTGNGKIDKKALTRLAAHLEPADGQGEPPNTPAEQRLAADWAHVLGIPVAQISRTANFFDLGGTSLSSVRLVIRLERLISPGDVNRVPVLADLARLVEMAGRSDSPTAETASGPARIPGPAAEVGTIPIVRAVTDSPADWAAEQRAHLHAAVARHGALLIRGLGLRTAEEAGAVLDRLRHEAMAEREAVAPRQEYAAGVLSASVWPADQPMCMHHELSYRREVPGLVLFACLAPGTTGGATGIADSAAVLKALPADVVDRFERDGWILARTYGEDLGVRWEDAFATEDRAEAERYCRDHGIEFAWSDDGRLRTRQRRAAVLRHPLTGERGWFNQIAFLSEWTMAPEIREYLMDVYGADGLPFTTFYGDGEPIGEDVIDVIAKAYEENTIHHHWAAGDVLVVDNLRTAHMREPYEGPRKICAALGDPVSLPALPSGA